MQIGKIPSHAPPPPGGAETPGVWRLMFGRRIAWSALKVALVVGTVLNLINNGQQWWAHQAVNGWQVLMNFAVPFCVSGFSAARNEVQRARGGE